MTDKDKEPEALQAYLKDCDAHAIVPDVGGAWHAAFQAGRASLSLPAAGQEPVAVNKDFTMTTQTVGAAELLEALTDYLEAQDALDNREYIGINAVPYEKLMRRRNRARNALDAALAQVEALSAAQAGGGSRCSGDAALQW